MEFNITGLHDRKYIKLPVLHSYRDQYRERYLVWDDTNQFIFERTLPQPLHVALKPEST